MWETTQLGQKLNNKKNIFISPVNLTANGPAHLGHVGGPFLRMDVLSRHLKRLGHCVQTALTTDQVENHIEVQAVKHNVHRSDFARENDNHIRKGLEALSISYDFFPNTGEPDVVTLFEKVATRLIDSLEQNKGYDICNETLPVDDAVPYGAVEDQFCVGGWFGASCPICNSDAGSYFCEGCGAHFQPSDAVSPYSRRGKIIGWEASRSAYLTEGFDNKLSSLWDAMRILPEFRKIAERYITKNGATMRLTVPSSYGIEWPNDHFLNRQALFSYSSLLYAHSLLGGSMAQKKSNGISPFSKASNVILLSATAIDNVVPMMVGLSGSALAQNKYRPFDRIYFNKFLNLEGLKFSTSRNHVIWALDIEKQEKVNMDFLRAYLCKICPEIQESDFKVKDFVGFHNIMLEKLTLCYEISAALLTTGVHDLDESWLNILERLYLQQSQCFDSVDLCIADSVLPIETWVELGKSIQTPMQAATWLMGFSFISSPVLPKIASDISEWLGFDSGISPDEVGVPICIRNKPIPALKGRKLDITSIECLIPSRTGQ